MAAVAVAHVLRFMAMSMLVLLPLPSSVLCEKLYNLQQLGTSSSSSLITNQDDAQVLLQLVRSAAPGTWDALSGWNSSSGSGNPNPCADWVGISCNPSTGRVVNITLAGMRLGTDIPSQFGDLGALQLLNLSNCNLTGQIPAEFGNCSALKVLDLSNNEVTGQVPYELGNLLQLQELYLNNNFLSGSLPAELGACTQLRKLYVFDNHLSGVVPSWLGGAGGGSSCSLVELRADGNAFSGALPEALLGNCQNLTVVGFSDNLLSGAIPKSVGSLLNLQYLYLQNNQLTGPLPPELGNCSELVEFVAFGNGLSLSIPLELGKLKKLQMLLLWNNSLMGSIPPELGYCSALQQLDVSQNLLTGTIPDELSMLQSLETLGLSFNNLTGSIPAALANCTKLVDIHLENNALSGSLPLEFGSLTQLQFLTLWKNQLSGSIPLTLANCTLLQRLDLSGNQLLGELPSKLFGLKNLQAMLLFDNRFSGAIPLEIGNCNNLTQLRLSNNFLSGSIPTTISKLRNLTVLELSGNALNGSLPPELGFLVALQTLDLHGNQLSGPLPPQLGSLSQLEILDISSNQISGAIPPEIGSLMYTNVLILSDNALTGSIPSELSGCRKLSQLELGGNELTGVIPAEIGFIMTLQISLNLSWNRLNGPLPQELANLVNLQSLDLSHNAFSGNLMMLQDLNSLILLNVSDNQFSGPVPNNELFKSLPPSALFGNPGLCAALSKACTSSSIPVDPPLSNQHFSGGERQSRNTGLLVGLTLSIAGLLLAAGFAILSKWHSRYWVRSQHHNSEDPEVLRPSWQLTAFKTLQFSLEEVVNNLESYSIIGKGKSGVVYRATTTDGNIVAVKKLTLPSSYSKEDSGLGGNVFEAQVERLSQLKHFNIVSILAHCSSKEVHLMLYEYMPNCSLGDVLHKHKPALQWNTRYCIALGTAEGLAYLHHTCVPSVVHGNLKSNNILLDTNLEPHIADFGLAKLLDWTFDWTSIAKIEGECGYIAPEYSFTLKATVKYDVYSYGVVLLELLTGQKVAEAGLGDGVDVVKWVQDKIQSKEPVFKLLDQCLQCLPRPVLQEALEVLGIALLCTHSSPAERPTMKDVVVLLKESRTHRDAVATNCVNE